MCQASSSLSASRPTDHGQSWSGHGQDDSFSNLSHKIEIHVSKGFLFTSFFATHGYLQQEEILELVAKCELRIYLFMFVHC